MNNWTPRGAKIQSKLLEVDSLLTPNLVERFRDIHRSVLADNSLDLDDKIEEMATQFEVVLKFTEGSNISTKRMSRIMRIMRKLPPMPFHVEYYGVQGLQRYEEYYAVRGLQSR